MKKLLSLIILAGLISCFACGPTKKDNGTTVQVKKDSLKGEIKKDGDSTIYEYAVKFIQGKVEQLDNGQKPIFLLGTGLFYTSVNIHNPGKSVATYRIKMAIAGENGVPGYVSILKPFTLNSDLVTEFDYRSYKTVFFGTIPPKFYEGYVVIMSDEELDVVGVYTGYSNTNVLGAMHMERVPARVYNRYD